MNEFFITNSQLHLIDYNSDRILFAHLGVFLKGAIGPKRAANTAKIG